jgi:hypothetical protein
MVPETCRLLLPLISPPTHANDLSMGIAIESEVEAPHEIEAFFRRSCITRLYSESCNPRTDRAHHVQPLMEWLPDLKSLVLCRYQIKEWPFTPTSAPSWVEPNQPQRLHEIFLVGCSIVLEVLIEFIGACGIQSLHLPLFGRGIVETRSRSCKVYKHRWCRGVLNYSAGLYFQTGARYPIGRAVTLIYEVWSCP